jgi:DNA mismatch repair ATPase MutS
MIALFDWRKTFNGNIDHWYDSLARFEMFSSYGSLAFNKPEWCYPMIKNEWFTLETKEMGHPLISPSKMVTNNFSLTHPNHLALITGSNMAGKSTFLRSIGANMVLARAGSPVCASSFFWSPGQCLTSMRISDNLQEETSTFYAELKKVKKMIEAIKAHEKVILLIDEMLRGTNAEDRKLGVNAFVTQMIKANVVGIIASHDSTVYHFSNEFPDQVRPYYFDSHVENDELKFDYKIKSGTDTTANASFLMKKIGIDI